MEEGDSAAITVFFDGQFWVGLVERVESGRLSVARIVFGEEPADQEILDLVISRRWDELPLSVSVEAARIWYAKNPKRRQREAAKELKRPVTSTKAQAVLALAREEMKAEKVSAQPEARGGKTGAIRSARRKAQAKEARPLAGCSKSGARYGAPDVVFWLTDGASQLNPRNYTRGIYPLH